MTAHPEIYNLVDEPWIPIIRQDGRTERLGIRGVLLEAGNIRQLAASNPMDNFALTRFLLAVLCWCKGALSKQDAQVYAKCFPKDWLRKLDDQRECFNLFGKGRRFFQTEVSGKPVSTNYLIHEIPTGTNPWHFRHVRDKQDGLCPACCAMGLVRLPVFTTVGGRGLPPGINRKPPVYVLPVGNSLHETLCISWRALDDRLELPGVPSWENASTSLDMERNIPLLNGLTWLPRSVWLDEPSEPIARCVCCATETTLVRTCVFKAATSVLHDSRWQDPHVLMAKSSPIQFSTSESAPETVAAATFWRKLLNMVKPDSLGRRYWLVGFATEQAKYRDVTEWYFEFPKHSDIEGDSDIERVAMLLNRCRTPKAEQVLQKTNARELYRALSLYLWPHIETVFYDNASVLFGGTDGFGRIVSDHCKPLFDALASSLAPSETAEDILTRQELVDSVNNWLNPKRARCGGRQRGERGDSD